MIMEKNNKISILYVILLICLPTIAISSSSNHHHKHGVKYKHFTLYQHDIDGVIDVVVAMGTGGGADFNGKTAPFGTISVLKDNITLAIDPSSKVVGDCEALTAATTFDGLSWLSVVRFALDLEDGLKGTISVLGVVRTFEPFEMAVTGGTKDFLLVQGYISSTIVHFEAPIFIYKVDFHLYWPSYAPYAMKG